MYINPCYPIRLFVCICEANPQARSTGDRFWNVLAVQGGSEDEPDTIMASPHLSLIFSST